MTPLSPSVRRGYAVGSVATGTFGTVPGLLLLPYLTDSLGIAAVAAGFIVFVPKAWDVVLNPVVGRLSDRSESPSGRRRPYLLKGGLALAVCFAALFVGPSGPPWLAATWVVVWFLACATAYAFFQVPYVAMPAEMTLDPRERTRLMTWRVVVLALAILLSGATAPLIVNLFGETPREGYRLMGLYVALVLAAGVVGVWRGTRHAPEHRTAAAGGSMRDQLRLVSASRPFRVLLTTYVLQAVGVGSMLAGVAYVADDLLATDAAATILFAAFVAPALLVTPVWERYAARRGKRSGYLLSSALLVVGAVLLVVARFEQTVVVYLAAAVVGVGYAGAQVFPLAMLPDVAAEDARTSGENRVGVFTGVWTAGETLGLAVGPGLFAVVLALGGYVSSTDQSAVQPDSAMTAIAIGFSVVPAALVAGSMLFLRRYALETLTEEDRVD